MATDSNNYQSKFKPRSCFFTDPTSIEQNDTQAFGPVLPPSASDKFRLTSKFTSSGAKAYAPCKGVVLVQPQTGNAEAVNLIIRPYTQPISGLNIKYFIYRGLSKASFFTGEQVLAATESTSEFINKINTSFISFHQSSSPEEVIPVFLARYIGFDPLNQSDDLKIASFFFKQSEYVDSAGEFVETGETAFELPLIEMGATLGNFIAGECGVDIVLNYGDYSLPDGNDEFVFDLAYARAKEALIDVSAVTDSFQQKLKREQIFQFLDAAAYYGFHSIDGGVVESNIGGVKANKKGNEIYTDLVVKFFTKNNVYLYIQSDRTRSYNFYGNYAITEGSPESLNFGLTEAGIEARAYNSSGWPLIIENRPQSNADGRSKLFVQFVTDNNVNTMLYGQVAQIDNAQHNNFCGASYLSLPNAEDGTIIELTKLVALSNPAIGSDQEKLNIATFNILIYHGKVYSSLVGNNASDGGEMTQPKGNVVFLDTAFDLIEASSLMKSDTGIQYNIITRQKLKLISHYYERTLYGISAVQTIIVEDAIDTYVDSGPALERTSYITETIDLSTDSLSLNQKITTNTKTNSTISQSVTGGKTYQLQSPFYFTINEFSEIDQDLKINGLTLKSTDSSVPGRMIIGLTKEENELFKLLITSNTVKNAQIVLLNFSADSDSFISNESITYYKYRAYLVAEESSGDLTLLNPDKEVVLYSLDKQYFFSTDYSKYMYEDMSGVRGDILNQDLNLA